MDVVRAGGEPEGGADIAVGSQWMQAYMRRDDSGLHRIVAEARDLTEREWRPVDDVLDAIQGPLMPEEGAGRAPADRGRASRSGAIAELRARPGV